MTQNKRSRSEGRGTMTLDMELKPHETIPKAEKPVLVNSSALDLHEVIAAHRT